MTHKEDTRLEACLDSSGSSANKSQDVVEGMPQKEAKRTKETHTLDTDDCVDSGVAEKNAMQDLAPTWVVESPCEPMPSLDKNSTTETSELSPTDNEKQLQRDLVESFPMDKQSLDMF